MFCSERDLTVAPYYSLFSLRPLASPRLHGHHRACPIPDLASPEVSTSADPSSQVDCMAAWRVLTTHAFDFATRLASSSYPHIPPPLSSLFLLQQFCALLARTGNRYLPCVRRLACAVGLPLVLLVSNPRHLHSFMKLPTSAGPPIIGALAIALAAVEPHFSFFMCPAWPAPLVDVAEDDVILLIAASLFSYSTLPPVSHTFCTLVGVPGPHFSSSGELDHPERLRRLLNSMARYRAFPSLFSGVSLPSPPASTDRPPPLNSPSTFSSVQTSLPCMGFIVPKRPYATDYTCKL